MFFFCTILICLLLLNVSGSETTSEIVYSLQMVIHKNDTVILNNITSVAGTPSSFPSLETGYTIKVISFQREELFKENLGVSFTIILDPIGVIETNSTIVSVRVPYFQTAKIISIYHSDREIKTIDLAMELCNKNDVCDLGENEYNCPEDCKEEVTTTTIPPTRGGFPKFYLIIGIVILIIALILFFILKGRRRTESNNWIELYQKWR